MGNYTYDELCHWGIKGMKWGVRRYQNADGTLTDAGKRRYGEPSDDYKTAKEIKKKRVDQMTNSELRKLNERTRLEQEYQKLNPNVVKKGWKYVGAAVGVMGTTMAFYNNSKQILDLGQKVAHAIIDTAVAKKLI